MLIDESSKGLYTSSDVSGNVVYEGELRCLEHTEIFQLIREIVECFINCKENEVTESEVPDDRNYKRFKYYDPHCYIINVGSSQTNKRQKVFENITINY